MFIEFEEKDSKVYESHNDHVEEIFKAVKEKICEIYETYTNNEDVCIAIIVSACVANEAQQFLSDKYGADKLIEMLDAKEV